MKKTELTKDAINKTSDFYEEGKEKIASVYNAAKEKTEELIDEVKDTASNVYKESKNKVNDIEDVVSDYTEELVKIIKDKPITSILIAGGLVYLVAKLLKK